jgi:uncharacterized membrane protein YfcA
MTWELSLTGLLIGALVGLTGMGGGSLLTPILVIVFGFSPTYAVGTDIVHGAIFKSVGAIRQRTLGNVRARLSGWMFLGSAPMSLAGVALATYFQRHYGDSVESVGGRILGGALVVGGLGLVAKGLIRPRQGPELKRLSRRDRLVAVAIGFFGGFIVGLTSVGSGVFFALTMLLAFPLRSSKVVGTDIFHAAALLWVAGAGHLAVGNVNMPTVGWLLLGSIPGILIGSQFTVKMPEKAFRNVLAVVLAVSGLKLLEVPGSTVVVFVALGCGLGWALAGLPTLLWLRRRRARRDELAAAEAKAPG